jgi:hypothetical protein
LLARLPGLADDQLSDHFWSAAEIENSERFDGLGFFDFMGYYNRHFSER